MLSLKVQCEEFQAAVLFAPRCLCARTCSALVQTTRSCSMFWELQSSTNIRSADCVQCSYKHHLLVLIQFHFMAASVLYLKSTLQFVAVTSDLITSTSSAPVRLQLIQMSDNSDCVTISCSHCRYGDDSEPAAVQELLSRLSG